MKHIINLSALAFLCFATTQVIGEEANTYNIDQEAALFKNEVNLLNAEVNQKILEDENYSDKMKQKVSTNVSRLQIKDEDIQKVLDDANVSEKKKHRFIKDLNKLKVSLQNKLNKNKDSEVQ